MKGLKTELKKTLVKTLIWPVALYCCETWTMKQQIVDKLNAFEMWVWRRMQKVSRKDKKTNEEILSLAGEERCLMKTIMKRKKDWIERSYTEIKRRTDDRETWRAWMPRTCRRAEN